MSNLPPRWTTAELTEAAAISSNQFRAERLASSDAWEQQYTQARAKFEKLFEVLSAKVPGRDFSYFINQRGMFSYTGFTPEQVDRLREEFAVYLVRSGRMCVAGLNSRNVDYVADAMAAVLKG